MYQVILPDAGEGTVESEIVTWFFDIGDEIKEDDILFLAESAMADAYRPGNPKDPTLEDIIALYKSLLFKKSIFKHVSISISCNNFTFNIFDVLFLSIIFSILSSSTSIS